jgi:hypothetical protein
MDMRQAWERLSLAASQAVLLLGRKPDKKHYSFIVRHCAAYYGRPTAFALLSRLVTSSCSAWSDSSGFEKK